MLNNQTDKQVEEIQQRNYNVGLELYNSLNEIPLFKDEVILDDRILERPNVKLYGAEMIGIPYTIVIGRDFNEKGLVEIIKRNKTQNIVEQMTIEQLTEKLKQLNI